MSRIPSGKLEAAPQLDEPVTGRGIPGRSITGEPTLDNIPIPIAIIPFGSTVDELPPHHQAELPPVLTIGNPTIAPTPSTVTTTTTTTTMTPRSPRQRMFRGLSVHRMRDRVAKVEATPAPRHMERSRSESFSQSADESPESSASDSYVFRKVTLNKKRSESRLKKQPSEHRLPRLAKTVGTPRPTERNPSPMVSSAPDALGKETGPPDAWKKGWRSKVKEIGNSAWWIKAQQMVGGKGTVPDLDHLTTKPVMQAAYKYKCTPEETASIYLYTKALFSDINTPLLKGVDLNKLRPNRRRVLQTLIPNIDRGLPKLPAVHEPLVRVVKLEEKFGNTLQKAAIWHQRSYGSCVREADRNMKWDGNYELHFTMKRGAYDVSFFSDAPREGEVLAERNRDFLIAERTIGPDGRVILELEEI